jgi:hypothetical protein
MAYHKLNVVKAVIKLCVRAKEGSNFKVDKKYRVFKAYSIVHQQALGRLFNPLCYSSRSADSEAPLLIRLATISS